MLCVLCALCNQTGVAVQLLDEMKQAASTCDGVAIFGIAGEVTGVPCAVDLELSASAPVVRGVTERAASAISAFACDDDDAPDDIDSPVEVPSLPPPRAFWGACRRVQVTMRVVPAA